MSEPSRNPQAEQMASESMARNLAAQAEAIWPQECAMFASYDLPEDPQIVDVGCGPGEITLRLAELFPRALVQGIDVLDSSVQLARARLLQRPTLAERVRIDTGDAFALELPDGKFDLAVCRHMLQSVPEAHRVLAELVRVTRPGGTLHLLSEDYGMMHFHPTRLDSDFFWREGPVRYATSTGTDLLGGRRTYTALVDLGLQDVTVRYVVVDTARVPRELFASIWRAWRDGYSETIAQHTAMALERVHEHWDDMIGCIEDPRGYAVWQIPILSARVPGGTS